MSNNHWLDMGVHAITRCRTGRLGTVTGFTTATFRLPRPLVDPGRDPRLVSYPIGARTRVATPELLLTPGDVIDRHIEHTLAFSSVYVYGGD